MLSLEKINEEIEKREKSDRLTNSVCQELSWLYTVRDHLEGKHSHTQAVSYPKERTQALDIDMYPAEKKAGPLTRYMAEEWMRDLQNDDGTTGPHWTLDQAKQLMAQKEIGGSPIAWWITLNMMYSDYCKVAKKLGVNTVDFYASMAEAFLNDKDAVGGGGAEKLAQYYAHIVSHD